MNSRSKSEPLIKTLASVGLISVEVALRALEQRVEGPLLALSRLGLLDEELAIKKVAERLEIPSIRLDRDTLSGAGDPEEFKSILSGKVLWTEKIFPLPSKGRSVTLICADPLNLNPIKSVEFALQRPVIIAIGREREIIAAIAEHYEMGIGDFDLTHDIDSGGTIEVLNTEENDSGADFDSLEKLPIVKLCNKIVADSIQANASDIHIEPTAHTVEVRYRIDGVMHNMLDIPKRLQAPLIARYKILSGLDIAERHRPQDGRMRVKVGAESCDLRVSVVPVASGEKIVMRLLRSGAATPSLDNMGLSPFILKEFTKRLESRGKLMLVTGPTGSGKTSTLYAALKKLHDGKTNIETVEDPIEYRMAGINQVQIDTARGLTFASVLRSLLRQDPDVIFVGEIRDKETAEIAMQAAQTGHLVLSTLHTNDAPSAVTRLGNLGISDFHIAATVGGILAQRLVRKLCRSCIRQGLPEKDPHGLELCREFGLDPIELFHSVGCAECRFSGYKGRTGLYSYLNFSSEVCDAVYASRPLPEIEAAARKDGFLSIEESALELVKSGTTSIDEIRGYLLGEQGQKKPKPALTNDSNQLKKHPDPESKVQGTVLFVGEGQLHDSLCKYLGQHGIDVCSHGPEMKNYVLSKTPTLIICGNEIDLSDENFSKLKELSTEFRAPLIVMTTDRSTTHNNEMTKKGFSKILNLRDSRSVFLSQVKELLLNK